MDIWDIVKKVGAGVISDLVPGGRQVVGIVNELLDEGKKLPLTATGSQVEEAIRGMTPTQKALLMEKQFDVEVIDLKESNSTLRAMLASDAANPHTTRPRVVLGMFRVVAFSVTTTTSLWAYAVATDNDVMVAAVTNGWPFMLSIIGPFLVVINAYFGILRAEHQTRIYAASGTAPQSLVGLLSSFIKK